MAVRFVSLLLKSSFIQLLQTETEMFIFYYCHHFTMTILPADKALRVELPEHGGDAPALYGLAAVGAHPGAEQGAGARLAVRLTLPLPEVINIIIIIIIIIIDHPHLKSPGLSSMPQLEQQNRSRRQVRPIAVMV